MTKTILSALTSLAALLYSPAHARTDLDDDYTDFLSSHAYKQQERYASRTECELPGRAPASPSPSKLNLGERISDVLKNDCGKVRVENNILICEDQVRCTKQETTGKEYDDPNSICVEYYCPTSTTRCIEWQMKERWRFNLHTIGKVEALLIDEQFEYALRPVGRNELLKLRTEAAARRLKNIFNSYGPP